MPLSNSIWARLEYQHETPGELIADIPEEHLRVRVNPEKWSPFEQIAHLAAYQPVFADRIERIVSEINPSFPRYVAEQDPLFPSYLEQDLVDLTNTIATDRNSITMKLKGLNEAAWQRAGLHPRFGRLTLVQWTEFFLLHEAHHLFTLFTLIRDPRFLPR